MGAATGSIEGAAIVRNNVQFAGVSLMFGEVF